jgi:hypothetical protein
MFNIDDGSIFCPEPNFSNVVSSIVSFFFHLHRRERV